MSGDELLTTPEVAEWLRIPVATLRTWRTRGAPGIPLPAIKVGAHVRYRRSDVEAWLEANTEDRTLPRRAIRRAPSRRRAS